MAIERTNYLLVADGERVQKYTLNGAFVTKWGSSGGGDGQFSVVQGIAVDSSGYVYVAEWSNHRIQKFRMNTASPLPAEITYTPLRGGSFVGNPARPSGFFVDPRSALAPPFLRMPGMFTDR